MQVDLAVLADSANLSMEGKLNIFGIFNRINTAKLPVQWPLMMVVFRITGTAGEKGIQHKVAVKLVDEDGGTRFAFPEILATVPANAPGNTIEIPAILPVANYSFDKYGTFRFDILINGNHAADIPLHIVEQKQMPAPPA